ncbi:hypothetical protein P4576_15005 [Peribacillus frigoritolerans]|uniref:hypothetical protein n=1 Tax=Peribacillus frigoritolerans TaxID=450367 RepID=UPI002E1D90D7|nr:hypothetical protein [Peribacillus frigoritolerans]
MTCTTAKEFRRMSILIIEDLNELREEVNNRFDQLEEKIDQVETNLEKTLSEPKSD